jgi:hypothetical protein
MTTWCRRLVLVLALAVMPLQGVAAALSVLFCHDEGQMHALHDQGSHEHGTHHDGRHDDDGTVGGSTYHLCCHFTVSAPAIVALPAALPDFPIRAFAPDSLHDLFIPDRPQRPPLA